MTLGTAGRCGRRFVLRGEEYEVAQRRANPYARAYSFGTDGNAAVAGSPISSYRPMQAQAQHVRSRRRRGIILPRWVYLAVLAVLLVVMLGGYSQMSGRKAALQRELAIQNQELAAAAAHNAQLDIQLEETDDEVRLRAIALNRLGMKEPTQEQVVRVPVPYVITGEEDVLLQAEKSDSGGGFLRAILSFFVKD